MLKQLRGLFKDRREIFDLTTLDDPVALATKWSPLAYNGNNFCTHRLLASQGRIIMKVTPVAHLICFFIVGIGVVFSGSFLQLLDDPSVVTSGNIPIELVPIIPLLFSAFGVGLLWWLYRKNVIFSQNEGIYTRQGISFPLNEVHAIQLIREYVAKTRGSYYSFEMNLVLNNGERLNMTDHRSLQAIRFDAKMLAGYLSIPVWDLIDYQVAPALL